MKGGEEILVSEILYITYTFNIQASNVYVIAAKPPLTYDLYILSNHWTRIRAEEDVKVKDSTNRSPREGSGGLKDHVWQNRKTTDEIFDVSLNYDQGHFGDKYQRCYRAGK